MEFDTRNPGCHKKPNFFATYKITIAIKSACEDHNVYMKGNANQKI
jgi:hypothetical protein